MSGSFNYKQDFIIIIVYFTSIYKIILHETEFCKIFSNTVCKFLLCIVKWKKERKLLYSAKCEFSETPGQNGILILNIESAIKAQTTCLYFFLYKQNKILVSWKFSFPVFDGFTRFGMSWTRFDYFFKISVCLSVPDQNSC